MISLCIPGQPQGKARARTTRRGHSYTPANTVLYENLIKSIFLNQYGTERKFEKLSALEMRIQARFQIPKSFSKKDRAAVLEGAKLPTKKPDFDNIAKVVADALNGLAYDDDCQIVQAIVVKQYSDRPCVMVEIQEWKKEVET